jgi:drug/metabolite transporter (DMT)-like permease
VSDENKKEAVLFTVIASTLWGTSFPVIKLGLQYTDPYTFVFLRFLFASLIMLVVMLITKNFSLNFNKKPLILFLGITNGTAYLLQYLGMVSAFASKSSLFVNLSVVWVALFSPIVLKEKIGRKKMAGVIVSLLGITLVTTNLDFGSLGLGEVLGDLLVIGAGILWAVFIIYNKPLVTESKNMIQSMTWLLLFTMLPLLPVLPFSAENFLSLSGQAWVAIIYTALFCWVVRYYLWLKGLKNISPVTSAVILLNEILVAVAISTIFLGEVMTAASAIGAILIVFAILAVSYE